MDQKKKQNRIPILLLIIEYCDEWDFGVTMSNLRVWLSSCTYTMQVTGKQNTHI